MQVIKRDGTIVEYNSEKINIAINLLNYGIDKKTISFSTGLSIEEINNLKRGS